MIFLVVGEGGIVFVFRSGGFEWDMINIYVVSLKIEFYDVKVEFSSGLIIVCFVGVGVDIGIYMEFLVGVGIMVKKILIWVFGYMGIINKVKVIEKVGSSYIYLINVIDGIDLYDISVLEMVNIVIMVIIVFEKMKGNWIVLVDYYSLIEGYVGGENGNFMKFVINGIMFK